MHSCHKKLFSIFFDKKMDFLKKIIVLFGHTIPNMKLQSNKQQRQKTQKSI